MMVKEKREKEFCMKKVLFGVTVLLLSALVLTSCGMTTDNDNGYKFKFKVDNNTTQTITKLEFINGNTSNDKVLYYTAREILPGKRSDEYTQSGFTVEAGSSTRYCGVKITFDDGSTVFGYDAFGHENKILVAVENNWRGDYISFSNGNW
jgi:hypothetical protein